MDIDLDTRIGPDGVRRPMSELTDVDAPSVPRKGLLVADRYATVSVNHMVVADFSQNEQGIIETAATSGTVDVEFDGETIADIEIIDTTTAAALKALLATLPNIAPADLNITGGDGGPFGIEWTGAWAKRNVPVLNIDDSNAVGGAVTYTTTLGGVDVEEVLTLPTEWDLNTYFAVAFQDKPVNGIWKGNSPVGAAPEDYLPATKVSDLPPNGLICGDGEVYNGGSWTSPYVGRFIWAITGPGTGFWIINDD